MVLKVHDFDTALPPCPYCTSSLLKLSDMWGVFYACDDCGFEEETLEGLREIIHFQWGSLTRQEAVA